MSSRSLVPVRVGKVSTPASPRGDETLDRLIRGLDRALGRAVSADRDACPAVQPAVRALFVLAVLAAVAVKSGLFSLAAIGGCLWLLAAASRVSLKRLGRRVAAPAIVFGLLLPLPAWGGLPAETAGREAAVLFFRVFNSCTVVSLWLLSTPMEKALEGLRGLGVPGEALWVLDMVRRFFRPAGRVVVDMHQGLKSRRLRPVPRGELRAWLADRLAIVYERIQRTFESVWMAVRARSAGPSAPPWPGPVWRRWNLADVGLTAMALAVGFV